MAFSTYSALAGKPKKAANCDNSQEVPPSADAPLGYTSAAYISTSGKLLDDPKTTIMFKTSPNKIGQVNTIAEGDKAIVSSTNLEAGAEVMTSQKIAKSDSPLGWEFKIADGPTAGPSDYLLAFSYKTDATSDVGLTYRGPANATSGETVTQLEPAKQWTQTVVYLPVDKIGTVPSATISSNNFGSLSIKDVRIGQIKHRDIGKGLVTLAFDDGWETVYSRGLPLFEKYHVPTTQFIVSDFSLGKDPLRDYLTVNQIKKMSAAGHEIASHSLAHCNAREMSDATLTDSINASQQQFTQKLGAEPKLYAHPFGSYDDRVIDKLSRQFSFIRSSDEGFNSAYYDPHNIKIRSVESDTTSEQIKSWVDQAAGEHKWLVLLYHKVGESGEYNVSVDQLDQQLKLITSTKGVEVVTVGGAIDRIAKLH